ncbi:sterol desaturase family protein [Leptothrix sp. BB-4]
MTGIFDDIVHRISDLHYIVSYSRGRTFWLYLLSGCVFAAWVYLREAEQVRKTVRGFFAWLFPARVYLHRSFAVDMGLTLLNHTISPVYWLTEALTILAFAQGMQAVISPYVGVGQWTASFPVQVALGLVLFAAKDFAAFFNHWLLHKSALLWEFHRVHHSAEHLNPFTLYRVHPVEVITESLLIVSITGTTMGLLGIWFDLSFLNTGYVFINIWMFQKLFNLLAANLRHSHVWVTFPGWLGWLIGSPALHQIHHSVDPVHYGKNLGFFFNIWDWAFGTLYLPKKKEELVFGVIDGVTHTNPIHAMFQPFKGVLDLLLGRQLEGARSGR